MQVSEIVYYSREDVVNDYVFMLWRCMGQRNSTCSVVT